MRVTFLGTGTSRGIPVIGCTCTTCSSSHPFNQRLRASVLLESASLTVVIDTSADFRAQMLRHRVHQLDAVIFTHHHVDHILGLDDVYPFNVRSGRPLPAYGRKETLEEVRTTFRYLFSETRYPGVPQVELHVVSDVFQIGQLKIEPVEVAHGKLLINGYRIGNFAYITDVSGIPEASARKLIGVEYLVLGGLRFRPHVSHFSISEAVEMAGRIEPRQTFLIHMSHEVEHFEASRKLPAGVALAYDGLVLEV